MSSLLLDEAAKKACSRRSWTLTNLELQKLLYVAQLRYKRRYPDLRLIDTQFEAWDLGPVAPALYHKVKVFGSQPVKNVFHGIPHIDKELDVYLYDAIDRMEGKTPAQLVALTHRSGGAWSKFYRPNASGLVIPDAAIKKEAESFQTP